MMMCEIERLFFKRADGRDISTTTVVVDSETGVVYFCSNNVLSPRYDAYGKIMVMPKNQLQSMIEAAERRYNETRKKRGSEFI